MDQKNITPHTVKPLCSRIIQLNYHSPVSHENRQKSCVSGRLLVHRETYRFGHFYLVAIRAHTRSPHSRNLEQIILATAEYGFIIDYINYVTVT